MGPIDILPSKGQVLFIFACVMALGWAVIELIIWLLSFVHITIG